MSSTRLLQLVTSLLLALVVALPSSAASRNKKEEKAPPMYPQATRQDPVIKQAQRVQKLLKKAYDLSQEDDSAATEKAATELENNKSSGAYEKSLAAQLIGHSWLDRDDYGQAITAFERALEYNGLPNDQHFQIMYTIAQLYMQDEAYDEALKWFDRFFAESKSEKPDQIALLANAYYRLERPQDAIDTMKRAISLSSDPNPSWYQILMASYSDLEQFDEAGRVAEELLAKNPNDKALVRNLSAIYLNAEMNDKAIELLERAKSRGMITEERDYKQLYQLYHYAEKEAEAIATIEEGLANGALPENLETYRTLAEANYFAERIPAAIEAYKKAAPFATDGEISLNLARVLYEEEHWADAKQAAYDALAKGIRRKGDAYILIGGAELEAGNRSKAIAAYQEAAKYPETANNAKSWLKSVGVK